MISLLLTFALEAESRSFQYLFGSRSDVRVLLTGIGQRNAERTIRQALAERPPELVLTCGFAGGLNPELAVGTVVFSVDEKRVGTLNPPPTPPRRGAVRASAFFRFPSWEGLGVGTWPPCMCVESGGCL